MTGRAEEREAARVGRRAVTLGSDDAVALSYGGFVLSHVAGELEDGAAFVDRALGLNPNWAYAWADPFVGLIDRILEDDKKRPAKQRHTSKRIFERLREEHGYAGGLTIVKDYVLGSLAARSTLWPLSTPIQVSGVKVPVESTTPRVPPTLQSLIPALVPIGGASSGRSRSDPSGSKAKIVTPVEST
jgi:hypothetical protein